VYDSVAGKYVNGIMNILSALFGRSELFPLSQRKEDADV
jgi:hypothetical protein